MEKLKTGDKYLSIQLLGKKGIHVVAFKNPHKTKPSQPDYIGDGVAIWVMTKKEGVTEERVEDL